VELKICVLSTKLHKHDTFHEGWVLLDTEKDVGFNLYVFVDSALATYDISSIDELRGDCVGGISIGVEVEGDECDFCMYEFAEVRAAYEAEYVELGSGPVSPETYSFELNSYGLQVSVEKS
jgi:hypothetical protein